jgi:hypothetical protein
MIYGLTMLLFAGALIAALVAIGSTVLAEQTHVMRALRLMVQSGSAARNTPWPTGRDQGALFFVAQRFKRARPMRQGHHESLPLALPQPARRAAA